ncbi:Ubiquitin-conjugating enzyme E2 W [Lucilia cuprina]|nr:Ubiquitin-conjugating enzyme E2 W [Lucilia cuprina]
MYESDIQEQLDDIEDEISYRTALNTIHQQAVEDFINSHRDSIILGGRPPPVANKERNLPRRTRVVLAQLRSLRCSHNVHHLQGKSAELEAESLWTQPLDADRLLALYLTELDNQSNFQKKKRLQKELMSLIKEPPPGVSVDTDSIATNLSEWKINIDGFEGTLYEGEHFQLLFKFNNKYPFDSPEVTFIGNNIPVHPHVYSNGHICLSILTEDWSPALSVQSVCLSIASMLSSCREKKRPPDNTLYVKTCNKNPKKTKWWYHDDSV